MIGYGAGGHFELGGAVVEPGPTRQNGWSAITLTVMEGAGIVRPCRLLITATGDAENTKSTRAPATASSQKKDCGVTPSLVEGIPARITLPLAARVGGSVEPGRARAAQDPVACSGRCERTMPDCHRAGVTDALVRSLGEVGE